MRGGSSCGRTPEVSVFLTSASEVISLWCPQNDVYILSASPNLEVLVVQVLELFGAVGYYPHKNVCDLCDYSI